MRDKMEVNNQFPFALAIYHISPFAHISKRKRERMKETKREK